MGVRFGARAIGTTIVFAMGLLAATAARPAAPDPKPEARVQENLFERSASVFDFSLWREAARAVPDELRLIGAELGAWSEQAARSGGAARPGAARASPVVC